MKDASEGGSVLGQRDGSAAFPYSYTYARVHGSNLAYAEAGEGSPILFLHGNPTSSYLWRNIMPYAQPRGRTLALDLIGMGKSDKPDINYTFQDHYRYVEGFIEALELEDVTLVVHDWGSALGLYYAAQHSDNVRAVAMMEANVPPVFPIPSYDAIPEEVRETFRAFRDPIMGPQMIVEDNIFIEQFLLQTVMRTLSDAEMDAYRAPFLEPASRKPLLVWPNEVPIGGEPERNVSVIETIGDWLKTAEHPKLLLYASPGLGLPPDAATWIGEHYANIETRFIGQGLHFIQEDQPEVIGRNLADWLRNRVQ